MSEPITSLNALYQNRKTELLAFQSLFMVITTGIVALRIYARDNIRAIEPDDCLVLVALFFAILHALSICISTREGWTYHLATISSAPRTRTIAWVNQLLFTAAVSWVKISILVFYLRLSCRSCFRTIVWGGIVFVTCWFVVFEVVIAMSCDTPIDPSGFTGGRLDHCIHLRPTTRYHGISNIISDFFVLILPMPVLWNLKMPARKKLGLICLFATGGIVCLFGTLRLIYCLQTDQSEDYTYEGYHLWLWSALQVDLALICASVPGLKILVSRFIPCYWLDSDIKINDTANGKKKAGKESTNGTTEEGKGWSGKNRTSEQEVIQEARDGVGEGNSVEAIEERFGHRSESGIRKTVEFVLCDNSVEVAETKSSELEVVAQNKL